VRRIPDNLTPVHRFLIDWLRSHAYGHANACPRRALVEAVDVMVAAHAHGFGELARMKGTRGEEGDLDRQVRALTKECETLGWPCWSSTDGYFYGNPADPEDLRIRRAGIMARVRAEHRQWRQAGYANEAETSRRRSRGGVEDVL
jgi:hypothetical protein